MITKRLSEQNWLNRRGLSGEYDKALDLVLAMDEETIDEYYNRFEDLVTSTSDIGWGYHDALEDMFHNAFPEE